MKERSHPKSEPSPQSRLRTIAPLLALALLLALATIACDGQDAKIAFISDRDGSEDIYVMNADGSDVTRLTHTDRHIVCCPRWSPDGQRIAFTSNQNGNHDIYLVNADGSGLTQLTHSDRDDSNPDWSPDGQRIAFISGHPGDLDSYLNDAAGFDFADRDRVQLLGDFDIYLVNADGSDLTQLTDSAGTEFYPRWSPDGQRIMFFTWSGPLTILHQMNADGSDRTKLIHHDLETESLHSFPIFSPDWERVERVVSFSDPDGDDDYEIYIANPDGSDLTQLTAAENYQGPRDEEPIVFSTSIYSRGGWDGNDEIFIMNPDGSGLVQLTDNASRDFAPHLNAVP